MNQASFNTRLKYLGLSWALIIGILSLNACSKQESPPAAEPSQVQQASIDLSQANRELWANLFNNVEQLSQQSSRLKLAIEELLAEPSAAKLTAAQAAWQNTAIFIAKLELLQRLSQAEPSLFRDIDELYFRIAATPIQPGFLDRFGPYEFSGLTYDIGVELNSSTLIQQHGLTDREEVVLGLYAIEFMLFGEQGQRSSEDYQAITALSPKMQEQQLSGIEEAPQNRRRNILRLQNDQLQLDLLSLQQALANNAMLANTWTQQSEQQQINSIRSAVSASLTHTLIELANMQSQLSAAATQTLPQLAQPEFIQYQLANLQAQLQALRPALAYYSNIERSAMQEALNQAQTHLDYDKFSNANEAQRLSLLQQVYQELKALI